MAPWERYQGAYIVIGATMQDDSTPRKPFEGLNIPHHKLTPWIHEQEAKMLAMTARDKLLLAGHHEYSLRPENLQDTAQLLAEDTDAYTKTKYGPRSDGFRIIYPNSHTAIYGAPGSGKTLLASWIAASVIREGGTILHIDADDNHAAVLAQNVLAFSGIDADQVAKRLDIVQPTNKADMDKIIPWVIVKEFTLIIVDSIASLEAFTGAEENSATDYVARVYMGVIKPLKASGATVISIDHTTKAGATRGPSGSIQKQAKADVALHLDPGENHFGRARAGNATVYVDKDRPGSLYAATQDAGSRDLLAIFRIPATGLKDATLDAPIGAENPDQFVTN
jgi:hypothetical protein